VQVQLQMHATGADVAYCVSYSVHRGIRVFMVPYCARFICAAARVLVHVYKRYISKGRSSPLPAHPDTQGDADFTAHWREAADILREDCVKVLTSVAGMV
jgi:hypothetical protein